MTCSIVARDPETGALGVAVLTGAPGVGAICPWLEAGVGAVCTQAMADPNLGVRGLDMLGRGRSAVDAIGALIATAPARELRQVALVNAQGQAAAYTGTQNLPNAGHVTDDGVVTQANMMLSAKVPEAMLEAWRGARGDFSERLLAALSAADALGADLRGQRSAALKIVGGALEARPSIPLYDLRVDNDPRALETLLRAADERRTEQRIHDAWRRALSGDAGEALAECKRLLAGLPPEEVRLRFWVAISFADSSGRADVVGDLLQAVYAAAPSYVEYTRRLEAAGRFSRPETAAALLSYAPRP